MLVLSWVCVGFELVLVWVVLVLVWFRVGLVSSWIEFRVGFSIFSSSLISFR